MNSINLIPFSSERGWNVKGLKDGTPFHFCFNFYEDATDYITNFTKK